MWGATLGVCAELDLDSVQSNAWGLCRGTLGSCGELCLSAVARQKQWSETFLPAAQVLQSSGFQAAWGPAGCTREASFESLWKQDCFKGLNGVKVLQSARPGKTTSPSSWTQLMAMTGLDHQAP